MILFPFLILIFVCSCKTRAGLKPQVCHRFQSSAYRSNQWRYRGRCDSIQFCVDKRIFIVGFGLYGSSNGSADYSVRIELKRLGRVLAENHAKFFSDGSSNTFHVHFEQPIQVSINNITLLKKKRKLSNILIDINIY